MAKARVLIVDDHPLVREGLAARISCQPDIEVCGEAADAAEAMKLVRRENPALVIVDLALRSGHGLDLIKQIHKERSGAKMLVVSAYEESLFAERALRAGALGYVNKQEAQEKVIDAIRTLLRGERYVSPEMTRRLLGQAIEGKREAHGIDSLTDRELEVFQLIGLGKGTRIIARELGVSVHTIETYRENIRGKLNLATGTELVQQAVMWVIEQR